MAASKWVRVRKGRPCPICQRMDWCNISADGEVAHCMRVESLKPVKSGGWIHRLADPLPVVDLPKKEPKKIEDVSALALAMFNNPYAAKKRALLAEKLGVAVESLEALQVGVGWDWDQREFASFPARDAEGKVLGITRRYENGEKKTLPGTSNSGIFVSEWPEDEAVAVLYVVEGGSDVAALLTQGFYAVGRPSNIGGAQHVADLMRRRGVGHCLVIGENDCKPEKRGAMASCPRACRGCAFCWPGKYGAGKVYGDLIRLGVKAHWSVVAEPHKDVRGWSLAGDGFWSEFMAWTERLVFGGL